jgi:dihydroorotase
MISIEGNILYKRGRIEIDEASGLITSVGIPTGKADIVLKDEIIFPGFIDLHVHAREDASHAQDYKEDFLSCGAAAINGGVVAYADMPNNKVPPIDDASYEEKKELTAKSPVPILLYAGIGPHTSPLKKKVPYKVFMGPSIGELFFTSGEELEKVIAKYKGENVSFHCEDPVMLEENKNKLNHEDKRPEIAEISAIDFAIELIGKYKLTAKICHASTKEGIEKLLEAKKRGLNITIETTPHHLYFDETTIKSANMSRIKFQVNPPIRHTLENRLALIGMLKRGEIDFLATDHAPHSIEEKEKGISGLTHLDTYGSFVSWLHKEHGFTGEEIKRVCAANPGKWIGGFLGKKYGEIKEGYVGSLTIINMNKKFKVESGKLKTKSGWSPFLGETFPGSVVMTVVKGKVYKHEK